MEAEKVDDGWITLFGVRMRPNYIEKSHETNDDNVHTTSKLSNFAVEKKVKGVETSGTHHDSDQKISEKKNRKRKSVVNLGDDEGKKRTQKGRVVSPEEERIPSLDDIPQLVEIIMSENGTTTMPVFLYKKRLEASDVTRGLNRLMINQRDKLMGFLKDEEISDFWNLKKGLKFSGIDSMGRVYELCLKTWPSLKTVVINSKGWYKLVLENKAEKGDWVQLWAYRRSGKFCLAVEFRKAEAVEEAGVDVASTSGTTTV